MAALWVVLRSLRLRIDEATQQELERLERATLTDSLTGIRNHRAFVEDLGRAIAHRHRHDSSLSLVLLDATTGAACQSRTRSTSCDVIRARSSIQPASTPFCAAWRSSRSSSHRCRRRHPQ